MIVTPHWPTRYDRSGIVARARVYQIELHLRDRVLKEQCWDRCQAFVCRLRYGALCSNNAKPKPLHQFQGEQRHRNSENSSGSVKSRSASPAKCRRDQSGLFATSLMDAPCSFEM